MDKLIDFFLRKLLLTDEEYSERQCGVNKKKKNRNKCQNQTEFLAG